MTRIVKQAHRARGLGGGVQSSGGPSDAAVLREVGRGRVEMVGILAGRYEGLMLGVAKGLLFGDEAGARDCVQESWVRVMRGARTYSGDGSAKGWLVRVVVNVCRDWGRGQNRRGRLHRSFALTRRDQAEVQQWDSDEAIGLDGPLARALGTLRDGDREVVMLCACRGLTHMEAAAALGIAEGTLKSRLYRSLKRLRVELEEMGITADEAGEVRDV